MKINKYSSQVLLLLLTVAISACDEDKILDEVPLSFTTIENSYTNQAGFEAANAQLYNLARRYMGNRGGNVRSDWDFWLGTDCGWHARDFYSDVYSQYTAFGPDNDNVRARWTDAYKMIANANTVIDRIEVVSFEDETVKNRLTAEARFMRAWAYRFLVYLFGDVPLILEEQTPGRGYTRAPTTEVLSAIIEDLQFAKVNLPDVDDIQQEGRLHRDVASHYLAETYLSTGDYQLAIDESSLVIDGGNFSLMTTRFGSRSSETNGNVWWDLFRKNNQNRSSGNTEGIWVFQVEYETPGGYGQILGNPQRDANTWERQLGPHYNSWSAQGDGGRETFVYPSTYHGGRGQGFFRPSTHMTHTIWQNVDPTDWDNDIRNANVNILRKWWIDNPLSIHYGDTIDLNNSQEAYQTYMDPATIENDTNRYLYPTFLKYCTQNNHELEQLLPGTLTGTQAAAATPEHLAFIASYGGRGPQMVQGSRAYLADIYAARLPETLLIRAEAYMNLGNTGAAAADINTIRNRVNATPVNAADVDIDLILDERLRELFMEEPRRVTLNRLGLLYDRTRRYNFYASSTVAPHNNLYPIPNAEIQNNTEAKLTQNDGY
ncbi:MAG: RagB/SusD family nutrient uptake outer membrane protein [Bacteroidota bacterium]